MNCVICKYNDGNIYTSIPVKYRCKITGEYHDGWYNCDVEFAPVRHGKWIDPEDSTCYKCSVCGEYATQEYGLTEPIFWHYCPNCGALMVNKMSDDTISRQAASGCEYWDSESNFCSLHRPSAERRGRWLHLHLDPDNITGHTKGECSICGKLRIVDNYCPNCGSRMDLEGDIE